MAASTPLPLALGRFKQIPQRSNEVWQGGLVKLPMWVHNPEDADGPPVRPTGAVWVSLRTGLLHMAVADEGVSATPELALKALIEFGLKETKKLNGRPSMLQVRDAQLKEALSGTLAPLNTSVMLVEELPAVTDALQSLEAAAGDGRRHTGMLEGTGVTVDQLRSFADAAATFFQAAPWRHLTNDDLIVAVAPQLPKEMRHLCVLGDGGEQFGLAFFKSRQAFEGMIDPLGTFPARRALGVTFGPIDDLPFADVDAWEDLGLPVVHPDAYPLAADLSIDGTMRRLNASELAAAEALLRALARTSEDDLDSGSWRSVVETAAGTIPLELTLPFLLEAERGNPSHLKLAFMPRLAERGRVRLARLHEGQAFESLDEANAATPRIDVDNLLDEDAETAAGRPLTPLEQAQEIAYDAMGAIGRAKIKLARRALAVSADCADACVILGEACASPEKALEWFERGVDAGVRAIGADNFAALQGEFWQRLDTRPYMRARLALAEVLYELGREEEALDHYRELLRLNPYDNQGVRHVLLPALLERGAGDEADRLLREYEDEIQAIWPYARALRGFQVEGDSDRARAALQTAVRVNPHVVDYLLDLEAVPFDRPPHFALGSKEEAASVAASLDEAFGATPGALDWLETTKQRGDRARRRKRSRTH